VERISSGKRIADTTASDRPIGGTSEVGVWVEKGGLSQGAHVIGDRPALALFNQHVIAIRTIGQEHVGMSVVAMRLDYHSLPKNES